MTFKGPGTLSGCLPGRTTGAVTSQGALPGRGSSRQAGARALQSCAAQARGPKYQTRPLPRTLSRRENPAAARRLRTCRPWPRLLPRRGPSSNCWKRLTATRPPPSDADPAHSPPILLLRQLHPEAQTTAPYSPRAFSDALPCRSRPLHNSRASASASTRGRA